MTNCERVHDRVRVEYIADGAIARFVMERGDEPINTFIPQMAEHMADAIASLKDVDCLVLCGEPEFSAGADLRVVEQAPMEMRSVRIDSIAGASNRLIRTLREFPGPVIAAVTGVAAGGGLGFALACDLVYMHRDAELDPAYTRIGLTPDNATPFFITQVLGPYRARELLFDPEPLSAEDATELGLANDAFGGSKEDFHEQIEQRAKTLADGPTRVYAQTKRLIDTTFEGGFDTHLEQERNTIKRISDSEAFEEGLSAFFEKREPEWG
ncbi:enoyl-CoA hydratase/isomerase family protein [Natrialbaceae archaeon A-gly3]